MSKLDEPLLGEEEAGGVRRGNTRIAGMIEIVETRRLAGASSMELDPSLGAWSTQKEVTQDTR